MSQHVTDINVHCDSKLAVPAAVKLRLLVLLEASIRLGLFCRRLPSQLLLIQVCLVHVCELLVLPKNVLLNGGWRCVVSFQTRLSKYLYIN